MLEIVVLAVVGTSIAGIWDFFTSEVPDRLVYLLAALGPMYWFFVGLTTSDFGLFFLSLFVGTSILIIGLILYFTRQWGEADAWIFASIGYMIPVFGGSIFMIDFIFNFFVVSIVYMVVYALGLGVLHREVWKHFLADVSQYQQLIITVPVACFAAISMILLFTQTVFLFSVIVSLFVLLVLFLLFWRYARIIECYVFRRRIPASKLRVGDVVADTKWVGITKEDITRLKKTRKTVTVKDGVHFVPVFPITLVVTILFGNLILFNHFLFL